MSPTYFATHASFAATVWFTKAPHEKGCFVVNVVPVPPYARGTQTRGYVIAALQKGSSAETSSSARHSPESCPWM